MATIEEYLKPPVPNNFSESNGNNSEVSQRLLPSDITNLLQGGVASAKAGDKELARSLFFKVITLDQNNESAWLWLASISEQSSERFEYLQKVLSINSSNERAISWLKVSKEHIAKTFVQKGADAAKEGDKASAVQYLLQAIDYDSENEIAWMWLASLAVSLEDKLAYLQRILNINPENEQVREMFNTTNRKLARSYAQTGIDAYHSGDMELAAKTLQDVSDYDTTDIEEVWLLKAHLAESLEEKEKLFERVVEINPNNQIAVTSLKGTQEQIEEKNTWRCPVCQTKEKKPFDICRVCNSILTLDDIDFALTNDSVNNDLVRDGIHNLKRGFKDEITSCDYYKLGLAYLNLKDLNESIAFFQASLRLEPENEYLASKIEQLTQALVRRDKATEQIEVPVVTEETLIEEDLTEPMQDYANIEFADSPETPFFESLELTNSELPLPEFNQHLSENLQETTVENYEAVNENQAQVEESDSLDRVSLFESEYEKTEEQEATANDDGSLFSTFNTEETEQVDSMGWPLPETNEESEAIFEETKDESEVTFEEANEEAVTFVEEASEESAIQFEDSNTESQVLFEETDSELDECVYDEELQKADTSPLELSASLREQVEESFGASVTSVEEQLPNEQEQVSFFSHQEEELSEAAVEESSNEGSELALSAQSVKEALETLSDEEDAVDDTTAEESFSDVEQEQREAFVVEAATAPSMNVEDNNVEESNCVEETFPKESFSEESFFTESVDTASPVEEFVASEPSIAESSNEEAVDQEASNKKLVAEEFVVESSDVEQEVDASESVEEYQSSSLPIAGAVSFSSVEEAYKALNFEEAATQEVKTSDDLQTEVSESNNSESSFVEASEHQATKEDSVNQTTDVEIAVGSNEVETHNDVSEDVETINKEVSDKEISNVRFVTPETQVEQPFVSPNYEIRVMQSPTVNSSVVEATHIGTVSQSPQVFSETTAPESIAKSNNKIIMIVDDSPTVRKLVSMKLGKSGHRVIAAVDGIDALAKITEEVPDLILLDVIMPRLDGYQLCKLIKSNETTKHVPIVMLSGKEGLVDKVRGKMAGATTFLTKPFEPETLLKTVNEHCGIQDVM